MGHISKLIIIIRILLYYFTITVEVVNIKTVFIFTLFGYVKYICIYVSGKYICLLTGEGWDTLEPEILSDWTRIFRVPLDVCGPVES